MRTAHIVFLFLVCLFVIACSSEPSSSSSTTTKDAFGDSKANTTEDASTYTPVCNGNKLVATEGIWSNANTFHCTRIDVDQGVKSTVEFDDILVVTKSAVTTNSGIEFYFAEHHPHRLYIDCVQHLKFVNDEEVATETYFDGSTLTIDENFGHQQIGDLTAHHECKFVGHGK